MILKESRKGLFLFYTTLWKKTNECEDITENDLIACASRMNVSTAVCQSFIEETRNALSHWYEYAEEAGVPEEKADRIAAEIDEDDGTIDFDEER